MSGRNPGWKREKMMDRGMERERRNGGRMEASGGKRTMGKTEEPGRKRAERRHGGSGGRRTGRKLAVTAALAVGAAGVILLGLRIGRELAKEKPEALIARYMDRAEAFDYEGMYQMVDLDTRTATDKEGFTERNSRIYEGIGLTDMEITNIRETDRAGKTVTVSYDCTMDTSAGEIAFSNEASFLNTDDGYLLMWNDGLIFPGLTATDKVSVKEEKAERGRILDRNGKTLAGPGTATSVGIVPGKLTDKEAAANELAQLLDMDAKTILASLDAAWVKEDSFVPVATIPKVDELDLMSGGIDEEGGINEELSAEQQRQEAMLEIPGVMLTDKAIRSYPLGEAAAHLIGYVQGVTAEDLEEHAGEGYDASSVIGRSGAELLYEKELKGQDGCAVRIVDETGNVKQILAEIPKKDGENIQLTIDGELQKSLYNTFQEEPGSSVALNPYTGEVLALVSTPSYDDNDFILGLSQEKWDSLNKDEKKPMYNRFRQNWVPGSVFKPVISGIGLKTGALTAEEDLGNEGLSWQKDSTWGSYHVTTLHDSSPANLVNALVYSDNIYFAKAALRIGADRLAENLGALGFGQELPFDISMSVSQYSNTDKIEGEIQLADSGYGQGQILMNPLHLASLYTAFLNQGNVLKPYLRYQSQPTPETWIAQAFSPQIVDQIMEGLTGVVNDPGGTGYRARREDRLLAGKTGTAELKATQEDTEGTEIGWFAVFPTERDTEKPVLLVSMVENVKDLGGSGFVVEKDAEILNAYWGE